MRPKTMTNQTPATMREATKCYEQGRKHVPLGPGHSQKYLGVSLSSELATQHSAAEELFASGTYPKNPNNEMRCKGLRRRLRALT
jgi:hypothetical protein